MECSLYEYKYATKLWKLYFPSKIHKKLLNVPEHPIISNCGTPTQNAFEFLDHHFKPVMQSSWSYIKNSVYFLTKIQTFQKTLYLSRMLQDCGYCRLYHSIPHELGLEALEEVKKSNQIFTDDLTELAKFVLQNNYFEFNREVK